MVRSEPNPAGRVSAIRGTPGAAPRLLRLPERLESNRPSGAPRRIDGTDPTSRHTDEPGGTGSGPVEAIHTRGRARNHLQTSVALGREVNIQKFRAGVRTQE